MQLKAKKRDITGSKVKRLRKENIVPGVIFGKGKESQNIQLNYNEFDKAYRKAGETEIVDLEVEGEEKPHSALIDEVQVHPVTGKFQHANFHEIDLTQKVRVTVPIEYTDQEEHTLIKSRTALFISLYDDVEVEVLPKNIPHNIKISITPLKEIGDVLTIGDLKKVVEENKLEILEENNETPIAKLDYAEMLEEEPEQEVSVEGVEITSEKKEEGEERTQEQQENK